MPTWGETRFPSVGFEMWSYSDEIDAGAEEARNQLRDWIGDGLERLGDVPAARWVRIAVALAIGLFLARSGLTWRWKRKRNTPN